MIRGRSICLVIVSYEALFAFDDGQVTLIIGPRPVWRNLYRPDRIGD